MWVLLALGAAGGLAAQDPAPSPQILPEIDGNTAEAEDAPADRAPADRAAGQTSGDGFDPHRVFTESNRRFNAAKSEEELQQAAAGYERLLERGPRNGHIYYNLGCTYLRLRDRGRAILNFRRALLHDLDPRYAQYARIMLERTREEVPDRFASTEESFLDTLLFWHSGTDFSVRLWILIVSLTGFWLLLALRLFTKFAFQRFVTAALAVVALAMGGSLLAELAEEKGVEAVVIAERADVRSVNSPDAGLVFKEPVASGVEVRILDTRNFWHQVEFPGGAIGWVLETEVEPVRIEDR